jgi:hypothetical protein
MSWTYSPDTKQIWDDTTEDGKGIAENYGDEPQGWLLAAAPALLAACQIQKEYEFHLRRGSSVGYIADWMHKHGADLSTEIASSFVRRKRDEAIAQATKGGE